MLQPRLTRFWFDATILYSSPIKWDLNPATVEFPETNWSQITVFILRTLHSSPWSSLHPQPGWGQNLPTVSHGTAGKLRGLGGICVFPSVAHSLLSKPLPLSAAICFQPYPTGRKHEHFHRRIWLLHKFKKKKKKGIAYGSFYWPTSQTWKIMLKGKIIAIEKGSYRGPAYFYYLFICSLSLNQNFNPRKIRKMKYEVKYSFTIS